MAANVSFELAVVAEGHLTVRASESLRPLLLAGWGCDSAGGGRREMVDRFESGQLVKFADFIWAHTQSGQSARMQSLRRGFQRGQESLHRRCLLLLLDVVMRPEGVWTGHPSSRKSRQERRRHGVMAESGGHHVSGVRLMDGGVSGRRSGADETGRFGLVGWRRRWRAHESVGFFLHDGRDGLLASSAIRVPRTEELLTCARNEGHSFSFSYLERWRHFERALVWVKRGLDSVATWLPMFAGVESWPSFYKVVGGGPCGGWLGGLGRRGELEEVKEGRASIGKRTLWHIHGPSIRAQWEFGGADVPQPNQKRHGALCLLLFIQPPLLALSSPSHQQRHFICVPLSLCWCTGGWRLKKKYIKLYDTEFAWCTPTVIELTLFLFHPSNSNGHQLIY